MSRMTAVHKEISHCIFDMDGLLLNTETFYTLVQQQILAKYGKEFTWALKAQMMGKKAMEAAQLLVDSLQLDGKLTAQEFLSQREHLLDALFPTAQLMPGAERLLRHLKSKQIPICLATSSHSRHYDMKTTNHKQLFSLFDHVVTGDQVSRGKPQPDIFLKAAGLFVPTPSPESCLVFEDAPTGVAAAKAANMSVVMVPDAELDKGFTKDADEVLASLSTFRPEAWGLPAFE